MRIATRACLQVAASLAASAAIAWGITSAIVPLRAVQAQDDPSKPAYFNDKVKPVLQANCYRCHGGANHRGAYNMNTRELLLKGGHHGGAVVPGKPEDSLLLKLVRHEGPADDPMNMPPAPKAKIDDADIAILTQWIKAGALTPADPLFTAPTEP